MTVTTRSSEINTVAAVRVTQVFSDLTTYRFPLKIPAIVALYEAGMKLQIIAVFLMVFGTLQSPVAAQDWSSWITPNNHDLQYRWLGSTPGGSPTCQLQVRDLKLNVESVVSLRIDYKFGDAAQSTREVVTITEFKGESLGERAVDHCVSVDSLHVNEVVRR